MHFMFVWTWYYVCVCIDTCILHIDVFVFVECSVYVHETCASLWICVEGFCILMYECVCRWVMCECVWKDVYECVCCMFLLGLMCVPCMKRQSSTPCFPGSKSSFGSDFSFSLPTNPSWLAGPQTAFCWHPSEHLCLHAPRPLQDQATSNHLFFSCVQAEASPPGSLKPVGSTLSVFTHPSLSPLLLCRGRH